MCWVKPKNRAICDEFLRYAAWIETLRTGNVALEYPNREIDMALGRNLVSVWAQLTLTVLYKKAFRAILLFARNIRFLVRGLARANQS